MQPLNDLCLLNGRWISQMQGDIVRGTLQIRIPPPTERSAFFKNQFRRILGKHKSLTVTSMTSQRLPDGHDSVER